MESSAATDLHKEISLLQSIRHPNIVHFYGAGTCPSTNFPFLVLELVDLGSLGSYLHKNFDLAWDIKISMALGCARGMAHVHSLNRMHRDLKSYNLLVAKTLVWPFLNVKVTDFGTTTILGQTTQRFDKVDSLLVNPECKCKRMTNGLWLYMQLSLAFMLHILIIRARCWYSALDGPRSAGRQII